MITLGTSLSGHETMVQKFHNFNSNVEKDVRASLDFAGLRVKRQMVRNLSGPSHSKGASSAIRGALRTGASVRQYFYVDQAPGNPFPGAITSNLRGSVQYTMSLDGWTVMIGPLNVVYAAIHEYGGWTGRNHATYIKPRPYAWPAWIMTKDEIMRYMSERIDKGLP